MQSDARANSPPRPRLGGRSARVREAVLAATVAELQDCGYSGLSISAVAERAGVHETSIYRRWKSRNGLVMEATFALFAQTVTVRDRGSLVEDLVAMLSSLARHLRTPLGRAAMEFALAMFDDPTVATELDRQWTARFTTLGQIFERASTRGEWPKSRRPELLLQGLIGAIYLRVFLLRQTVSPLQLRVLIEELTQGANDSADGQAH